MANYRYSASMWDFGHDGNGNPISHFELRDQGKVIARTNKRREQSGYDGTGAEAALYALIKQTGKMFDIVKRPSCGCTTDVWFKLKRKRANG